MSSTTFCSAIYNGIVVYGCFTQADLYGEDNEVCVCVDHGGEMTSMTVRVSDLTNIEPQTKTPTEE